MADEKIDLTAAHRVAVSAFSLRRVRELSPSIDSIVVDNSQQSNYETLLKQVEDKLEELESVKAALEEKSKKLAVAEVNLEAEQMEARKRTEAFKEEYKKYQESKDALDKLRNQIRTSYSTDDISSFLNETIKKFNEEHSSDSNVAQYVINNLDVDLKVRIYDDSKIEVDENGNVVVNENASNDKKSLKFIAPGLNETTEDSLSSIKITIQAVPK